MVNGLYLEAVVEKTKIKGLHYKDIILELEYFIVVLCEETIFEILN